MANVLTTDEIKKLPRGATHVLPTGTLVTSAARELAEARQIDLQEQPAGTRVGSCGCTGTSCTCGPAPAASSAPPPPARPPAAVRKGPTPGLWSNLVRGTSASSAVPQGGVAPSADPGRSAPPAVTGDPVQQVLGRPETHLDGCYIGDGPCDREDVIVVTAVGRNRPRVIAELASGIADQEGDIQEISQRIVGGHFHSILTVDTSRSPHGFGEIKAALEKLSREGDYIVHVQHEKVFKYMHRI